MTRSLCCHFLWFYIISVFRCPIRHLFTTTLFLSRLGVSRVGTSIKVYGFSLYERKPPHILFWKFFLEIKNFCTFFASLDTKAVFWLAFCCFRRIDHWKWTRSHFEGTAGCANCCVLFHFEEKKQTKERCSLSRLSENLSASSCGRRETWGSHWPDVRQERIPISNLNGE